MKKLKINDKKFKDVLKKGITLTTIVSTLVAVSGCSEKQIPEDWPSEFHYISQENNDFEDYTRTIIVNGESTTVYNGKNLAVAINKETYEVKEYVFRQGIISAEIYDLQTGYLIQEVNITTTSNSESVKNNKVILDNCYVVEFVDIKDYVEGHNLKNDYTIDEIRELEPLIVESVKKLMHMKRIIKRQKNKV